ncbi:hypothetical protein Ciccas_006380 [Cichlidogyrus casuarinus]|uniref:Uncharacterized protein n=1 Tax=Cichlidogyrus casuarinus TaxID=1844966 RepID=A0ABD2Q5Y2_9PLAT
MFKRKPVLLVAFTMYYSLVVLVVGGLLLVDVAESVRCIVRYGPEHYKNGELSYRDGCEFCLRIKSDDQMFKFVCTMKSSFTIQELLEQALSVAEETAKLVTSSGGSAYDNQQKDTLDLVLSQISNTGCDAACGLDDFCSMNVPDDSGEAHCCRHDNCFANDPIDVCEKRTRNVYSSLLAQWTKDHKHRLERLRDFIQNADVNGQSTWSDFDSLSKEDKQFLAKS